MKILVSGCLLGENCKYNGGNNRNEAVAALAKEHELITICPEVMGGLSIPREPAEIGSDGAVNTRDGQNVTAQYRLGAQKTLAIAEKEKPDLCVLQSRSPSCGVYQRYDGTFSGTLIEGAGITAQLLKNHGFTCIEAADVTEGFQNMKR